MPQTEPTEQQAAAREQRGSFREEHPAIVYRATTADGRACYVAVPAVSIHAALSDALRVALEQFSPEEPGRELTGVEFWERRNEPSVSRAQVWTY